MKRVGLRYRLSHPTAPFAMFLKVQGVPLLAILALEFAATKPHTQFLARLADTVA
jgi:hypothetical protein